jgi:membrane protease YdiL (CAAX protease family)
MQREIVQPDPVPWTIRDVWLGVGALALWMAASFGLALLVRLTNLGLNPGLYVGLAELLLVVPVWWLTVHKYQVGWEALGLRGFRGALLGLGCGLMIVAFSFNLVYGTFLALFDLRAQVDLVPIFTELSSPWWFLVAGIIVAPVVEELFFRGFVFAGLRGRYGWLKAALVSSALFAVIHLQPLAIPPVFILGFVFAVLYQRSGSIWPAILMHLFTNALGLGAAYLAAEMGLSI